jgi:DNA-binding NtrC family response regulator
MKCCCNYCKSNKDDHFHLTTSSNGKPIILVVDNELDTLTVMKKLLEMYDFIVHAIADPISALEIFNNNSHYYSLVLSDISMSKMSGFDFAKRISNINQNVKVLLMTALDIDLFEFRKVVSSVQVADFIQKPLSINRLVSIIERYVTKDT